MLPLGADYILILVPPMGGNVAGEVATVSAMPPAAAAGLMRRMADAMADALEGRTR